MPPSWVVGLCFFCVIAVAYLLPMERAKAFNHFFINSENATLLAAISAVIAFIVVLFTAYQIVVDLDDRAEERLVRKDEGVSRSWDRLLGPAVGNTGKGDALTYLFKSEAVLDGIDLSCESLGNWDGDTKTCSKRVIFAGISLDAASRPKTMAFVPHGSISEVIDTKGQAYDVDLRHADIRDMTLRDFVFDRLNASQSKIRGLVLENSTISGDFTNTSITECTLRSSRIYSRGTTPPELSMCEISETIIPFLAQILDRNGYVTAWADKPPLTLGGIENDIYIVAARYPAIPHDFTTLRRVRLCRPPIDSQGKILDLIHRPPLTNFQTHCNVMSPEAAIRWYPEGYVMGEDRSWFRLNSN